jgi:hypothetical protein
VSTDTAVGWAIGFRAWTRACTSTCGRRRLAPPPVRFAGVTVCRALLRRSASTIELLAGLDAITPAAGPPPPVAPARLGCPAGAAPSRASATETHAAATSNPATSRIACDRSQASVRKWPCGAGEPCATPRAIGLSAPRRRVGGPPSRPPASGPGTTAWISAEPSPQKASAGGAASGNSPSSGCSGRLSDSGSARLPKGTNSSRGPSQSRGNGRTLPWVRASPPPPSVFGPLLSTAPRALYPSFAELFCHPWRYTSSSIASISPELAPLCLN